MPDFSHSALLRVFEAIGGVDDERCVCASHGLCVSHAGSDGSSKSDMATRFVSA